METKPQLFILIALWLINKISFILILCDLKAVVDEFLNITTIRKIVKSLDVVKTTTFSNSVWNCYLYIAPRIAGSKSDMQYIILLKFEFGNSNDTVSKT